MFKRRPYLLYPPLIILCYVLALLRAISKDYSLAIVLAIMGTFFVYLLRNSPDGKGEIAIFPNSTLTQRTWAAIARVPADIKEQFFQIIVAQDIPVQERTVACTLALGAFEGNVPNVDWPPPMTLEDLDPRVRQFVIDLRSWLWAHQAVLKALRDAGRAGLFRWPLVDAAGGGVPSTWVTDMVSDMAQRGELVMRNKSDKPSGEHYWLPKHAPVSHQGP